MGYNAIKIFSATKQAEREGLGDRTTKWLRESEIVPLDIRVFQSSDAAYHCLTVVVFYKDPR